MLMFNGKEAKVIESCKKCGKPNKIETYFLDKLRIIPYPCDCTEEEENTKRENEEERKKSMVAEHLRRRCFENNVFKSYTFDRDDRRDPEASDTSMTYAEKFDTLREEGTGLIFRGNVGCGKTFLASCIANYLINAGRSCLFVNTFEILHKLKFEKLQECSALSNDLNSCDLLILDDFVDHNTCANYSNDLYYLINYRFSRNLPTIITSNYEINETKYLTSNVVVQAFISRIVGSCVPVTIVGDDRRSKNTLKLPKFKLINCKRSNYTT